MKVTKENIKDIKYIAEYKYIEDGKKLLDSLLIDLAELNNELINKGESYKQLYIDYEDKHTEYSPERIDPCPDYYGLFTLRFINSPETNIGGYLDINELDSILYTLINFIEFKHD